MRPEPPTTSAAPLHLDEPVLPPEPALEFDVAVPRIVLDRSLWRPLAILALVVCAATAIVRVVRYSNAEVDRAGRELARGGFGQR